MLYTNANTVNQLYAPLTALNAVMNVYMRVKLHGYIILSSIVITLLFTMTVTASPLPVFKAEYQADIKGFRVKASRELTTQTNGQQLILFKASSMIASLEESTLFIWENNYLRPIIYSYNQNVIGKKEHNRIDFDHTQKQIVSQYKDGDTITPYSHKLLDKLSYQLQLQQDLRIGKNILDYTIIRKGQTKQNQFVREGKEIIKTEFGDLLTVKVKLNRTSNDRQTYIWFAVDWDYMLVRFEQYEKNKKEFVINLTNATIANKRITGLTTTNNR